MSTIVCFALPGEAAPFRRLSGARSDWRVVVSGMGSANAQRAISEALAVPDVDLPRYVLTCGLAGGLNPELTLGTVVFETDADFPHFAVLAAAGARPVRFQSSDRVVVTAAAKHELRQTTGADAVEMESAAIRRICCEKRIPCATIRVISDTANEDLPLDFNRFVTPQFRMNYPKLLAALSCAPTRIGALWRFHRQTQAAAEELGRVLFRYLASTEPVTPA